MSHRLGTPVATSTSKGAQVAPPNTSGPNGGDLARYQGPLGGSGCRIYISSEYQETVTADKCDVPGSRRLKPKGDVLLFWFEALRPGQSVIQPQRDEALR